MVYLALRIFSLLLGHEFVYANNYCVLCKKKLYTNTAVLLHVFLDYVC